jgi:AbrB family looped-hinge helix DNA binding protein
MEAKVSSKGWIVIPAELRHKYDLKPGDKVHVVDYGGVVSLVPHSTDPVAHAAGLAKGRRSLTKALIEEHRQERGRGR